MDSSAPERSAPSADASPSLWKHLARFWRDRPGEAKVLLGMSAAFLLIFFLPLGQPRFENAVLEGLRLTQWYAREHVILCLLPAFVIAGAMAVYISQGAVMKRLGPASPKPIAFGVPRSPARCWRCAPVPYCRYSAASTGAVPGSAQPSPFSTRGRRSTSWPSW